MISFSISLKPGIPIYEQVVFAVKRAVVAGELKPGDKFPSVRELSKELRINPNTAQKAVSALVLDNLLEIKPGIGSIVSELSAASSEQRAKILENEVEQLVVEARRLRISKKELLHAIDLNWDTCGGKKK